MGDDRTATRCWKQSEAFDCLNVLISKNNETITRFQSAKLDKDTDFKTAGYSCMRWDHSLSEVILASAASNQPEQTLTSNRVESPFDTGKFWTREHVQTYMRDNGVPAQNYFNCAHIIALLDRGSLLSIGTTELTYPLMLGDSGNAEISSGTDETLSELAAANPD